MIIGGQVALAEAGKRNGSIRPVSLGSEADLRAAMAAADPRKKVMLAYLLYMTNGQTALSNLQNDRYPDMQFESFADFAGHNLPVPAEA